MEGITFGLWLKQWRKRHGLSRQTVGHLAGCSEQTLCKIEVGERKPSAVLAERLLQVLEVPPDQWPGLVKLARAGGQPAPPRNAYANLPSPPSPFIGREGEVARMRALLADPEVRLLTLLGLGGIGKTRLALNVAGSLLGDYPNGVFFVDLATVSAAASVPGAIAQALGLPSVNGGQPLDMLQRELRQQQALLLLDNFEQVREAGPSLAALLAAAPGLKLLVTSREPLCLICEHVVHLPPLDVPDLNRETSAEELAANESVRLFTRRIQAFMPDSQLTPTMLLIIARICVRLEGLPLAIELAAARHRRLSLRKIEAELDNQLGLLVDGPLDLPVRQRAMRATLAWSYDRLAPPEQELFATLGLFVGGASEEAVQAVTGLPDCEHDALLALAEKQLITLRAGHDGTSRIAMLEVIRAFALEQLGLRACVRSLRQRHFDYYHAFVARAAEGLVGRDQLLWRDALDEEYANIRAALTWALDNGMAEPALTLIGNLWQYWQFYRHIDDGRHLIAAALDQSAGHRSKARVKVLWGAGWLAVNQGDYEPARALFSASLELARVLGDERGVGRALHGLGEVAHDQGRSADALELFSQAMPIFLALDDLQEVAWARRHMGTIYLAQGDLDQAERWLDQALADFRRLGHRIGLQNVLGDLGMVALERGELDLAIALFNQGLSVATEQQDHWGMAVALLYLGIGADELGELEQARDLLEQSREHASAVGHKWAIVVATTQLGLVLEAMGELVEADARYRDLAQLSAATRVPWGCAAALTGLASLALIPGNAGYDPCQAARLLGAADRYAKHGLVRLPSTQRRAQRQLMERLRAALDLETLAEEWRRGQAMPLDAYGL